MNGLVRRSTAVVLPPRADRAQVEKWSPTQYWWTSCSSGRVSTFRWHARPRAHPSRDARRCSGWVFVLPNTNHQPATMSEPVVGVRIALYVGENLRAPKLLVGLWPRPMLWAAMPEAAIYEDGNLSTSEHDIRSPRRILQWLGIDRVSKPHCVQQLPDAKLSRRIALRCRLHALSGRLRGRQRRGNSTGYASLAWSLARLHALSCDQAARPT